MKLRFLIVLLSMLCSVAFAATPIKWVDRIIMVVNDDVITQRDLSDMMFNIKKQLPKGKKLSTKDLKTVAMQKLLEDKLLAQYAKSIGLTVSDKQIDEQLKTIASARKMSIAKLYEVISKEGVDKNSLRATIANQILVQKLLDDSKENLQVTVEEVNDVLKQNNVSITPKHQEQAAILLQQQKFQQAYGLIIEQLRSVAYIKVNDKPY